MEATVGSGTLPDRRASPNQARLAGTLAAGVALGVGELLAGITENWQSLVISVDNRIIDLTPGDAARTGIETFGSSDKPLLILGTVLLALAIGSALGRATLRHRGIGGVGFASFGLLGAFAGVTDPLASASGSVMTALVAATAGAACLYGLLAVAEGRRGEWMAGALGAPPTEVPTRRATESPTDPATTRRAFFGWAGAAGVAAVTSAGLGRVLKGPSAAETARAEVQLTPADPTAGLPTGLETEVEGIAPLVTPTDRFYRIDTALIVPQVDPGDWELQVTGMVDQPYSLSFDELVDLATHEFDVTLSCVSNEVGGELVGNARWQGVPLADLLERAGVGAGANQIVGRSVDGWTAGFPTEVALDGRPALVAVGMNNEPLPISHGFPARLVVAGLYGYVSATKWLQEIELTTWEDFDGYWVPKGWSKEGPTKTSSRIDVPRRGTRIEPGRQPIAGVAWAGERGIAAVEVQVDEGDWLPARLGEELATTTWRQWVLDWDAEPGLHSIRVRATDGSGETQTEAEAPPDPDGSTGWHLVRVEVGD